MTVSDKPERFGQYLDMAIPGIGSDIKDLISKELAYLKASVASSKKVYALIDTRPFIM